MKQIDRMPPRPTGDSDSDIKTLYDYIFYLREMINQNLREMINQKEEEK